jgi:hypothetical protein
MTQHPPSQPDSADKPNFEVNPAAADTPVSPTWHSGIESTIVTESTAEWSLGPAPSMPGTEPPPSASSDLKELATRSVIGDFQVQRILGTGAFATVYLAVELSLSRFVALKVTGDLGLEGRRMA